MKNKMDAKSNINKIKIGTIGGCLASLGAILASSCCVLPIILFNLGIGGAWISNLAILQPYREYMIGGAIIFLVSSIVFYMREKKCEDETCTLTKKNKVSIFLFLLISLSLIAAALIWPSIEPLILRWLR